MTAPDKPAPEPTPRGIVYSTPAPLLDRSRWADWNTPLDAPKERR